MAYPGGSYCEQRHFAAPTQKGWNGRAVEWEYLQDTSASVNGVSQCGAVVLVLLSLPVGPSVSTQLKQLGGWQARRQADRQAVST